MNRDIRWGLPDDGHTFPIYAGPASDLERVAEYADERGVTHIRFGGDTWPLRADDGAEASAQTGTGTWTVTGDGKNFKRSERYTVQADRHTVEVIAESGRNFVLDIDGEKAGQFSSDNRGLRNLHVEFEGPGEKLPLDVQIFLSWVARRCLETRMVSSVMAWIVLMVLFIPIAVLVWIGFI